MLCGAMENQTSTFHFFRYLIPGLVFLIVLAVLVIVGEPKLRDSVWNSFQELDPDSAAALLISLIFSSGGLGYLFSVLHHLFLNFSCHGQDYTDEAGKILGGEKKPLRPSVVAPDWPSSLSRRSAWLVVTTYWHSSTSGSEMLDKALHMTERHSDYMHGAGSSYIATIAAVIAAIVLRLVFDWTSPTWNEASAALLAFVLIIVMRLSYKQTVIIAERSVKGVLWRHLDGKEPQEKWAIPLKKRNRG